MWVKCDSMKDVTKQNCDPTEIYCKRLETGKAEKQVKKEVGYFNRRISMDYTGIVDDGSIHTKD